MRKFYIIIVTAIILVSTACELKLKQYGEDSQPSLVEVQRYDRLQSRYLTTGDFSALQQMNIEYPMETRTLIEDVLKIGEVNDPEINSKFLNFYQDTILQSLIADAELQYANMSDINRQFSEAFKKLRKECPDIQTPVIYSQIGSLDQSVIIGNTAIGISLDKYLGDDYPLYERYYTAEQRSQMTREHIVPDCMSFYLLSLYPLKNYEGSTQYERDLHMGKIMWIVNKLLGRKVFSTKFTAEVDHYAKSNPHLKIKQLLEADKF
mgnify:CR=1 FL=1